MTTTTPAPGCDGDGCTSCHPWPLHHLRHRGLCTSCILRYHRDAFCSACFDLLPSPNPPIARCYKCPAAAHLSCIPNPNPDDDYLCPSCESLNPFSYFPADDPPDGRRRSIDLTSAKVLLAAAQLAAMSMTPASTVARAEAERKVYEAILARKRARVEDGRVGACLSGIACMSNILNKDQKSEKRYQFHEPVQNDSKDRLATLPNHVKQEQSEREINGLLRSFTDVKDVERSFAAEGSRTQQGAVVPRTNNGARLMHVPSTASLLS